MLVTGATGQQGGATARALREIGWNVRALVRDPGSPRAQRLERAGVELAVGDLDDRGSLENAVAGAHGVFSVQPLAVEQAELETEVRRGVLLADVAARANAGHFVYSSVGGADRHTGIDHFESKAAIEDHLAGLDMPVTILRPTFFMDNLLGFLDVQSDRVLELPVLPGRPMQMIATSDIGRIAAAAFDDAETWIDVQIEIAGDEISFEQVAEVFARVTDVPTRLDPQPIEDAMFTWFAEEGYRADLVALRRSFPGLVRFEEFLGRQRSFRPVGATR